MDVLKKKRTRNNRELINEIKTLKKKLREKSKLFNEKINDLKKGEKKQKLINQHLIQKINKLEKLTEEKNNAYSKLYKEEIKRFLFKSQEK